jgi:hypothetical protein
MRYQAAPCPDARFSVAQDQAEARPCAGCDHTGPGNVKQAIILYLQRSATAYFRDMAAFGGLRYIADSGKSLTRG